MTTVLCEMIDCVHFDLKRERCNHHLIKIVSAANYNINPSIAIANKGLVCGCYEKIPPLLKKHLKEHSNGES